MQALTERRGLRLTAAHVAFSACCCAFASFVAEKPELAYISAGVGVGMIVLARSVLLWLVRCRKRGAPTMPCAVPCAVQCAMPRAVQFTI